MGSLIGMHHALDGVVFCNGGADEQIKSNALRYIQLCWDDGRLPIKVGKKWLVGFTVSKDFFHTSCSWIAVGPAKPRNFKQHWLKIIK